MDNEARKLVQALLDSGQDRYVQTFSLLDRTGERTGEEVMVLAVRIRKGEEPIQRMAQAFKAVAKPAGQSCPMCGGTGRV